MRSQVGASPASANGGGVAVIVGTGTASWPVSAVGTRGVPVGNGNRVARGPDMIAAAMTSTRRAKTASRGPARRASRWTSATPTP